jgi:hypothetical protein
VCACSRIDYHMASIKSLDKLVKLIDALLHDVQTSHGAVFNCRSRRLTLNKVKSRLRSEGIGFLTKTLPSLGKSLDKALSLDTPLNSSELSFETQSGSKLPRFLGELFNEVLNKDGTPLQIPCVKCVSTLRQILYLFYKYELPYSEKLELQVLDQFKQTETELTTITDKLDKIYESIKVFDPHCRRRYLRRHQRQRISRTVDYQRFQKEVLAIPSETVMASKESWRDPLVCSEGNPNLHLVREARILLSRLFASFDPKNIVPRHGPGAVATKQQLWSKYLWTNVSAKITDRYPLDEYFYACLGHVCDRFRDNAITDSDLPARVILVPKDSRGPRLISCEPVDYQWIQQGLGRAIVRHVEEHWLTKHNVFFSNQQTNRFGALLGSLNGEYATLDLKEASDRITVSLVRLLFPEHISMYLLSCRSSSTVLPDGTVLPLQKFAPMGSALCFPIMALCIWAILTAPLVSDTELDTREGIAVYGDDVIVPSHYVGDAIELLEAFGLKINRAKSCIKGFFRESCGMDAFKGSDVTPTRLRTVWSSSPSPESYTSWIAYANSFWDKKYYHTYDCIVEQLHHLYGDIPDDEMSCKRYPSLRYVPEHKKPKRWRTNHDLQKREWLVRYVKSPMLYKNIDGWSMLLRFFTEAGRSSEFERGRDVSSPSGEENPFSVRLYTRPRTSMLVRGWR